MSDRAIIGGSLAVSVALHLGALALVPGHEAPDVEGGAASVEPAQIGDSFRDIAQGSVAARPALPPDTLAPTRPEDGPPEPAATAAPVPQPVAAAPAPAPSLVVPRPSLATAATITAEPARLAETTAAAERPELRPIEAVPPDRVVAALEPPEVTTAAADTPRPAPRPDRTARAPGSPEPPAKHAATAPGAERAERRGEDDGAETAAAAPRTAPAAPARADQGTAAASSYPGIVMRQLTRTPRPQAGRRGAAVVGFELGPGGELRHVMILRSSGHAAIDEAALEHVRRAAPFPAPPQGAERRFQVRYESRG